MGSLCRPFSADEPAAGIAIGQLRIAFSPEVALVLEPLDVVKHALGAGSGEQGTEEEAETGAEGQAYGSDKDR